jgi:GT2 family glycosyltransferase
MIKIAIAILNWNGKELLEKFLPSVLKHSKLNDSQIFIIDNCSSDDSISFIENNYPQIKIIPLDNNYGFAEGYNRGLSRIDAKYFILLNSDVEVTENWLDIVEIMDEDVNIAACQPKIKSYYQKEYFEYAGAAGGYIDKFGYSFCRGRIFNVYEIDNDQYNSITDIFWATGACLFIRADLYNSVGGLDKNFFAHMEEIDLCWRLKNRGYKIKYYPFSTVFHLGGGTLNKTNPQKTFLNFRNNLFLLYKNLPPHYLFYTLFIRMLLDAVAGFKFLFGFEYYNFFAVIKAHFSFYFNFLKLRKSRYQNIKYNVVYQHPEIYKRSIVFDFFFKKIKTFSKLNFNKKIDDQEL